MTEGKILFVTGASSDVGNALIRKVEKNYEKIWAHFCDSQNAINKLQEEYGEKIIPIQSDFFCEKSIQDLIYRIIKSGNVPDHVVHLAAPQIFNKKYHKCLWRDYQEGIDISLRPIVMILKTLIPEMIKKKYGKVVFMLTDSVIGMPPKFLSPYITVKYALLGLMKSLAVEYAGKGITINAVSPDMMETKFLSGIPELVIEQNAKNNPLGRNLTVDDVIPAFEYFLSEKANVVTGQNIGITGGKK
ncbi:SDR family oxidoreductase [Lachnospiraceae bacterium]|jgi:3-oxoacyl-[acyl-carrier protein] reductase|nr:SDR family oxidoreductase [uncultured Schaedlerella sp.]NBI60442.1 SDR family oxidoreductase [Lachnospiraceae bacterium]